MENGIRVATETTNSDYASVGVTVNTGSRYENAENNGVGNYLEHMIHKGTAIAKAAADAGVVLNVTSTRESVFYHATGPKEATTEVLTSLGAVIQQSLTDDAVNAERGNVLAAAEDTTVDQVLFDRLHETAFRGHALGRTISGPAENIQRFTADDLESYKKSHYTGRNIVVSAAGAVNHDVLSKVVSTSFGGISTEPPVDVPMPVKTPAMFTGSDIRIRFDSMPHAHIAVSFPTAGATDPDHIPLLIIEKLLGSWTRAEAWGTGDHSESQLVANLSKEWWAEDISPHRIQYSDTGLFGVNWVAHERCVSRSIEEVFQATTRTVYNVSPDELEGAKNQAKVCTLEKYETPESIVKDIGFQLTNYGRRIHATELLERIESVDVNGAKSAAQRFFYDRDYALSAIGPILELHDYTFYRHRTFWKRY